MTKDERDGLLAFQALTEIGIIAQLSRTALERACGDRLSAAGFGVLAHLSRLPAETHGDWGPARLARAFQVTKGAMTNTLQRLEAENYVKIVGAPDDARAKIVTLTAKGDKARLAALVRLGPQISQITAKVGAETFAALLPHLAKLRACLDAARG